jgi:isoleucyl-tRNA synthetase
LLARWQSIRAVRAEVLKRIEEVREKGQLGSSLQAEVDLHVGDSNFELLDSLGQELRFVMLTSRATVHRLAAGHAERVEVSISSKVKCDRCWHYRDDVGSDPAHPSICGRCADNLFGRGEERRAA